MSRITKNGEVKYRDVLRSLEVEGYHIDLSVYKVEGKVINHEGLRDKLYCFLAPFPTYCVLGFLFSSLNL